jgi:hypothetical protein
VSIHQKGVVMGRWFKCRKRPVATIWALNQSFRVLRRPRKQEVAKRSIFWPITSRFNRSKKMRTDQLLTSTRHFHCYRCSYLCQQLASLTNLIVSLLGQMRLCGMDVVVGNSFAIQNCEKCMFRQKS